MVGHELFRQFERIRKTGAASSLVFGCFFSVVACSNSNPEVRQNSPAPALTSRDVIISDLAASALLAGSCEGIGRLDKGFEIQLDGSTWISQPTASCLGGRFEIRVEKLGQEMQFQNHVRATKQARVRRSSITGKVSEVSIAVRYIPDQVSGGVADGGGVTQAPAYTIRGSFQNVTKESDMVATSTDAKFKMILSRDKDRP